MTHKETPECIIYDNESGEFFLRHPDGTKDVVPTKVVPDVSFLRKSRYLIGIYGELLNMFVKEMPEEQAAYVKPVIEMLHTQNEKAFMDKLPSNKEMEEWVEECCNKYETHTFDSINAHMLDVHLLDKLSNMNYDPHTVEYISDYCHAILPAVYRKVETEL